MASKTSYVGNIPWQATEADLEGLFESHGTVESVRFIKDRETQQFRGFGFVTMSSEDEARAAEQALDGQDFQGRPLKVNEAEDKAPRQPKPLR